RTLRLFEFRLLRAGAVDREGLRTSVCEIRPGPCPGAAGNHTDANRTNAPRRSCRRRSALLRSRRSPAGGCRPRAWQERAASVWGMVSRVARFARRLDRIGDRSGALCNRLRRSGVLALAEAPVDIANVCPARRPGGLRCRRKGERNLLWPGLDGA